MITQTPINPLEVPDTKAYFAWKATTRFNEERTPDVKLGWDAACDHKNRELADMTARAEAAEAALAETRSVIAGLREEVAMSKINGKVTLEELEALEVKYCQLEAQRDALISSGGRFRDYIASDYPLAVSRTLLEAWDAAVSGAQSGANGDDELARLRADLSTSQHNYHVVLAREEKLKAKIQAMAEAGKFLYCCASRKKKARWDAACGRDHP